MYEDKLSFLEKILGQCKFSHNTKEAEYYCVFCNHHKKKLSINMEKDVYKCWVCGKSGNNVIFVLRKAGASSQDIEEYKTKYKSKSSIVNEFSENYIFRLTLPKDFVPLVNCKESFFAKRHFNYLEKRGISEDKILHFKIGVCPNERIYEDRIILPSFDAKGYINYYTSRSIISGVTPTYVDPLVQKGYKTRIIINELNIDWKEPIVVVEGFFDMLKASKNTVPILGSILTEDHILFEKVVTNGTPVVMALDPDADLKSFKIAESFMAYDIPVYNIDVNPYKDVGEMDEKEFLIRLENAAPVSKTTIMKRKLRMICQN